MPPPPPHLTHLILIDELVEECFLHLQPDDPAGLVRVALVCKRWRRILEDRSFHHLFRERHGRTPRMLGFFHVDKRIGACFTPTSSFHPRIADADDFRYRRAIDSRHGRVLLAYPPSLRNLTVWDPITGEQIDLPGLLHPPQYPCQFRFKNSRAAVLCADSGGACDHVDCHRGHFVVVLLHTSRRKVDAHVYSSQAGTWSQTSSAAQDLDDPRCFYHSDACALAGNTLYFSVYTKMNIGILKYDLGAQEIGFVDLPPDCVDRRRQILLTTREDGGLGIARIENSRLHLWSSDGALGWAPSGVIELETRLPLRRAMVTGCIYMVSFVHGLGAFLVRVNAGSAFTVDIVSGRVRKVADNRRAKCFVPYTSFCIPGLRNQVHGVSN